MCEIWLELTVRHLLGIFAKTVLQKAPSDVVLLFFFVNFEQILHTVLLHNGASIVGFAQLNTSWTDNFNPLSAISTEWSNTLKQFADELFECIWPFCGVGL